jgi:hypothetical protein
MTTIFYLPAAGDFEDASVCDGRFRFKAFQATEMPDIPPWDVITDKLRDNPAFGLTLDEDRKSKGLEFRQKEQERHSDGEVRRVMRHR